MSKKLKKCIRCGQCCTIQICEPGKRHLKVKDDDPWKPCPYLKKDGEVYTCRLYEEADDIMKQYLYDVLFIGKGCMNELKREVRFLKRKGDKKLFEKCSVPTEPAFIEEEGE